MRSGPSLFAAVLAAAFILTGCGGGKNTATTTNSTKSVPAASPAAPGGTAAVPASLHCGAVAPVWANTRTHVYHVSSDPLYGRTKHGEYMCPQTAASEGYHRAGSSGSMDGSMRRRHRKGGSMMQAQPSPSPASE